MFIPGTCQHCFDHRSLRMSSAAMDMPLGRNSSIYIYKTTCNAIVPEDRQILSTGKPKVANTQIVMGQRAGQSHLPRYYSSAEAFAAGGKPSARLPPGEFV